MSITAFPQELANAALTKKVISVMWQRKQLIMIMWKVISRVLSLGGLGAEAELKSCCRKSLKFSMDFYKSHLSPLLIGNQESNSLSAVTSPVLPSAAVNNIRSAFQPARCLWKKPLNMLTTTTLFQDNVKDVYTQKKQKSLSFPSTRKRSP